MPKPTPKKIKPEHKKHSVKQVGAYAVSGWAFFWSGYLVFLLFDKGFHTNLLVANVAKYAVGLSVNFILQHYWVFGGHRKSTKVTHTTIRYAIITIINFFIDLGILTVLKSIGITPYIGQFVSSGFFTIWNYYWYKLWVFRPGLPK